MRSYRELLKQVKSEIEEIDVPATAQLLEGADPPAIVDVRERDEWQEGHIPGAVHVPRGNLESRIEQAVPDRDRAIVVYCASGNRSAFAAKTLEELGYTNVTSLPVAIRNGSEAASPSTCRALSTLRSGPATAAIYSSRRLAKQGS